MLVALCMIMGVFAYGGHGGGFVVINTDKPVQKIETLTFKINNESVWGDCRNGTMYMSNGWNIKDLDCSIIKSLNITPLSEEVLTLYKINKTIVVEPNEDIIVEIQNETESNTSQVLNITEETHPSTSSGESNILLAILKYIFTFKWIWGWFV